MDAAEFIIEGDATKAVAAMYQFEAAAKRLEKTLKSLHAGTINDSETHIAAVKKVAAEYVATVANLNQAKAAVKGLTQAQKELAAAASAPKPANVYGLQELDHYRLAASEMEALQARHMSMLANNEQRAATLTNARLNRLRSAAVAAAQIEDAQLEKHLATVTASAAADSIVDARRARDLQALGGGMMSAADKAMRFNMVMGQLGYAASDFFSVTGGFEVRLRAIANNIQMMSMLIPGPWGLAMNIGTIAVQAFTSLGAALLDSGTKADAHKEKILTLSEYYAKLADELGRATEGQDAFDMAQRKREMDKTLDPERKKLKELERDAENERQAIDWAKKNNLDPTTYIAEHKRLVAEKVKTKGEIDKVEADFAERERALKSKADQRKAEEFIRPAEDSLSKLYGKDAATMGRDAAMKRLLGNIAGELPSGLRGPGVAESQAKRIAEKTETDLAGQRLKERFDGRTPEETALLQKKEEIRRAKIAREEQELAADADGKRSRQEKKGLDATDRFIKGLEIAAMKLESAFDTRKEADRVGLINGPRVPVPQPINRNAGL